MKVFIILALIFSTKAFSFTQKFKVFPSHGDAFQFITELNSTSRTPFRIYPLNFKGYEKAKRVISEVMEGYREVFPRPTYDLPDPHPIIVHDNSLNSFVFPHTLTREGAPFVIMVFSGMFKEELTEDEFYGVMAHELAHLIFEHSNKDKVKDLEIFYQVDSRVIGPLGFRQKNNLRAEKIVTSWLNALKNKNFNVLDKLKSKFDLNTFRVYTTEEQADDASIRVLNFLGRDETSIGKFMLRWLSPTKREECLLMIERGEPVPYGNLLKKHRSDCWRYDHSIRLAEIL